MGYVGGKCKVRCEGELSAFSIVRRDNIIVIRNQFYNPFEIDLLNDDITKSAQCAQIVLNTEGFKAWKGWEKSCKKDATHLPPLTECFRNAAVAG